MHPRISGFAHSTPFLASFSSREEDDFCIRFGLTVPLAPSRTMAVDLWGRIRRGTSLLTSTTTWNTRFLLCTSFFPF